MRRYLAAALLFKILSTSGRTKRLYRLMGNTIGARRRARRGLGRDYLERAKRILALSSRHPVRKGDRLLEIGTGWVHWESTVLRLFHEVSITLVDVWDNRQLGAYQRYCGELDAVLDEEFEMSGAERENAHALLRIIRESKNFEEVYRKLGMRYVVDPTGTLRHLHAEPFDLVYSCAVLEHVHRDTLSDCIQDYYHLLKPGGYSIQQIDLSDHLAHFDGTVSRKNYLRYSDAAWKRFFESDIQYFNRVQRPEWLHLFREAGFELVEERAVGGDIGGMRVDRCYGDLTGADLACVFMQVVHRKPGGQSKLLTAPLSRLGRDL